MKDNEMGELENPWSPRDERHCIFEARAYGASWQGTVAATARSYCTVHKCWADEHYKVTRREELLEAVVISYRDQLRIGIEVLKSATTVGPLANLANRINFMEKELERAELALGPSPYTQEQRLDDKKDA